MIVIDRGNHQKLYRRLLDIIQRKSEPLFDIIEKKHGIKITKVKNNFEKRFI